MASYLRPSLIRSFRRAPIITLRLSSNLLIANPHVTCWRNSSTSSESHDGLLDIDKSLPFTGTMKGYSLEQDLRSLINHPERSDIEILCKHGKSLFGCKAILASRSEIFNKLIYKEGNQKQISFPEIHHSGMEIILEYFYTGSIKENLTKYNIIETYHAAKYLNLLTVQDLIFNEIKNNLEYNYERNNYEKNCYSPELLSKALEMIPLKDDDEFLNLLVKSVAIIPLNKIKYGRLSIEGLQYLLHCTLEKKIRFATTEYEVLRYSAILAAKQVSNEAQESLTKNFPALDKAEEQIKEWFRLNKLSKGFFIKDRRIVARKLEPLIESIDFKRIKKEILDNIIKPLGIIPNEIIDSNKEIINKLGSNLNDVRGIPTLYEKSTAEYIWDEFTCDPNIDIKDDGKVVDASNILRRNVRTKMILEKGIYEWEVIIEKSCAYTSIGVCASENFDHEIWAGYQPTGWVLNFNGYCYNSKKCNYYCPPFIGDGTKIIVHLNMDKRTCAFTVNGTKYPEVSKWDNLPSKLYPVVSLSTPAQCRIQPYQEDDSSHQYD